MVTVHTELYYHCTVQVTWIIDGVRESCNEIRTPAIRKGTVLSQAGTKENDIFQRCT
jgi:hypothetical protein